MCFINQTKYFIHLPSLNWPKLIPTSLNMPFGTDYQYPNIDADVKFYTNFLFC